MPVDIEQEKKAFVSHLQSIADAIASGDLPIPTGLIVLALTAEGGRYIRSYNFGPNMSNAELVGLLELEKLEALDRMRN